MEQSQIKGGKFRAEICVQGESADDDGWDFVANGNSFVISFMHKKKHWAWRSFVQIVLFAILFTAIWLQMWVFIQIINQIYSIRQRAQNVAALSDNFE